VARVDGGSRYRLAVSTGQPDIGVRLVDLESPRRGGVITAGAPFCDSTSVDLPGRFSPDGSQIAFTSNRSRGWQVWVANRDGTALRPLTQFQDAAVSGPSWSPDGRWLAIVATIGDRAELSIVPVDGGPGRRLETGATGAIDPAWSRDGRWIYFASTQSDRSGIWKISAAGGGLMRLTSDPGFDPHESADGRSLYFIDRARLGGFGTRRPLKRLSMDDGLVETVDLMVFPGAWDVTNTGIVFIADHAQAVTDPSRGANTLQAYDFIDHRVRTIGQLAFVVGPVGTARFLTISRDGRWALASHVDRWERDILVLDGFR
jgi:dipeptidyl aminopeptidase/acylaminoacyl peptidase